MSKQTVLVFVLSAIVCGAAVLYFTAAPAAPVGVRRVKGKEEWNDVERRYFDEEVRHAMAGSKEVPEIPYHPFINNADFADLVMDGGIPVIIRNMPAKEWEALRLWKSAKHFAGYMPVVDVHVPAHPTTIRMHHEEELHPFSMLHTVNWTRRWREQQVPTAAFFSDSTNDSFAMYHMSPAKHLPAELQRDIGSTEGMSAVWNPPLEFNVWIGAPTMTTPAHFDWVHNFYTQVVGKKRFVLIDPGEALKKLYPFSFLHPSARQTQIDFYDPHPAFTKFKAVKAREVVLSPGDVLYIPPFYFHHVCVVGEGPSISLSTHSDSHPTKVRGALLRTSELLWDAVLFRSEVVWTMAAKVGALQHYVSLVCGGDQRAVVMARRLLAMHFAHLELDDGVDGLVELIEEATATFPDPVDIRTEWENVRGKAVIAPDGVNKSVEVQIERFATEMARVELAQFKEQDGVELIIAGELIEYISARVIGSLNVKPFLEATVSMLQQRVENAV